MARLKPRRGASLIELTLYAGMAALAAFWAADFKKTSVRLDQFNQKAQVERDLDKALETIENDLREADSDPPTGLQGVFPAGSVVTLSKGQSPIQFTKTTKQNDLTFSVSVSTIQYAVLGDASTPAVLARTMNPPVGTVQNLFSAADPSIGLELNFRMDVSESFIDITSSHTVSGVLGPIVARMSRRVAIRTP